MKYFLWLWGIVGIVYIEHTLLPVLLPFVRLELGVVMLIGYTLSVLEYRNVTIIAILLGVIEGMFSLAPLTVFVVGYLFVGNLLVFVGRNITTHGFFATALVGFLGSLLYILVSGVVLYGFFQVEVSVVHARIGVEFMDMYVNMGLVGAGAALAAHAIHKRTNPMLSS